MPATHIESSERMHRNCVFYNFKCEYLLVSFASSQARMYWKYVCLHLGMCLCGTLRSIWINIADEWMRYRSKWNLYASISSEWTRTEWTERKGAPAKRGWGREDVNMKFGCVAAVGFFRSRGETLSISIHWEFILNSILVFGFHSTHFIGIYIVVFCVMCVCLLRFLLVAAVP